ncbi:MAG: hypothetical protein M0T80_08745, partial [Actinomycetota bacterium]|nr:hypothetical protein [Actinomycetota bacterium]
MATGTGAPASAFRAAASRLVPVNQNSTQNGSWGAAAKVAQPSSLATRRAWVSVPRSYSRKKA